MTYHLMDEDFDTGPILAPGLAADAGRGDLPPTATPLLASLSLELLHAQALARLEDGDRGDPRANTGAPCGTVGEDYQRVDWSRPAAEIHRQVCAWQFLFTQELPGPLAEIDGKTVRLVATSLTDPGGRASDRDRQRSDLGGRERFARRLADAASTERTLSGRTRKPVADERPFACGAFELGDHAAREGERTVPIRAAPTWSTSSST